MNALRSLWSSLPAPFRTVINVALGAALAAAVGYGVQVVSGDHFDVNVLLAAVATAVGTAVVRALNPIDTAATGGYGLGAGAAPSTDGLAP